MKDWAIANGESRRAEQILDEGNFKIPARESVLVQSATGTVDQQAEFSAAVGSVVQELSQQPDVAGIVSPIEHPNAGLISQDRHSVLVQFDVKGKADQAKDKIAPILAAIDGVQTAHPSMVVEEFGQASADYQVTERFERDMRRAELTSLPLTLGDPDRRVRRARRGGTAGAPRVLRGARGDGAQRARQPRRARPISRRSARSS